MAQSNAVLQINFKLYNMQCSIPTTGGDIQCEMIKQREQSKLYIFVLMVYKNAKLGLLDSVLFTLYISGRSLTFQSPK